MRVTELDLSLPTLVCCQRLDLADVDQLLTYPASELVGSGFGPRELYELIRQLNRHGHVLPTIHGAVRRTQPVATERNLTMLQLRLVEGMTLREIADRVDSEPERIRQILRWHFGVLGVTPTFRARKWAAAIAAK
jgi:DNA-binding NarL/FixJ family response regulator